MAESADLPRWKRSERSDYHTLDRPLGKLTLTLEKPKDRTDHQKLLQWFLMLADVTLSGALKRPMGDDHGAGMVSELR